VISLKELMVLGSGGQGELIFSKGEEGGKKGGSVWNLSQNPAHPGKAVAYL